MTHQVASMETIESRWRWLPKLGGVAALATGILLLMGLVSLIPSLLQPGTTNDWLLRFQNNWLVKIFVLHAEFSSIHTDLYGLNLLDTVLLLLVSMVCLGLTVALRNDSKVWPRIAFALSLITILLFVITQIAGRSTVMLAVLLNSLVMLRDKTFRKVSAYLGIAASVFLFVGDLTVGIHSNIITILFGVGYMLLILWFSLIAQRLLRAEPAA